MSPERLVGMQASMHTVRSADGWFATRFDGVRTDPEKAGLPEVGGQSTSLDDRGTRPRLLASTGASSNSRCSPVDLRGVRVRVGAR